MAENQTVSTESTTENKSVEPKKRVERFHLMAFIDSKDGMIHQMGIGQRMIEAFAVVILLITAGLIAGWVVSANKAEKYQLDNIVLQNQVEALNQKITDLENENTTMADKITILSDTINAKVEKENATEEEVNQAHTPSGFPLTASAKQITEDSAEDENAENTEKDASLENMLLFEASKGTNVVAAGAGVVSEIVTHSKFEYKLTIDHENGYKSIYYNSGSPMVKEGDEVISGYVLFIIEDDNKKFGYQILENDVPIDPTSVLAIDG